MMFVEESFDLNDWVVIFSLIAVWLVFFFLPKIFSLQMIILILLFGIMVPSILDNTIGAKYFDFYDILDGPKYSVMDALVYFLYPPFSYFFLYFFYKLKMNKLGIICYIFCASLLSLIVEYFYTLTNVFTYKNGFNLYFSFCIYLVTQSGLILFFRAMKKSDY